MSPFSIHEFNEHEYLIVNDNKTDNTWSQFYLPADIGNQSVGSLHERVKSIIEKLIPKFRNLFQRSRDPSKIPIDKKVKNIIDTTNNLLINRISDMYARKLFDFANHKVKFKADLIFFKDIDHHESNMKYLEKWCEAEAIDSALTPILMERRENSNEALKETYKDLHVYFARRSLLGSKLYNYLIENSSEKPAEDTIDAKQKLVGRYLRENISDEDQLAEVIKNTLCEFEELDLDDIEKKTGIFINFTRLSQCKFADDLEFYNMILDRLADQFFNASKEESLKNLSGSLRDTIQIDMEYIVSKMKDHLISCPTDQTEKTFNYNGLAIEIIKNYSNFIISATQKFDTQNPFKHKPLKDALDERLRRAIDFVLQEMSGTKSIRRALSLNLKKTGSDPKIFLQLALRQSAEQYEIKLGDVSTLSPSAVMNSIRRNGDKILSLSLKDPSNAWKTEDLATLIKLCPSITTLKLTNIEITEELIRSLNTLKNIKSINLSNCDFSNLNNEFNLSNLNNIRYYNFKGSNITERMLRQLLDSIQQSAAMEQTRIHIDIRGVPNIDYPRSSNINNNNKKNSIIIIS